MNEFLTPLTADGFRKLRRDPAALRQALDDACQLAGILKTLFHSASHFSVLMMAQRQHPNLEPGEAVKLELARAKRAVIAIRENGKECQAISDAERARLAPATSRATSRVLAIAGKAGVPQADIERLTPAFDEAAFSAEVEALKAEQAALESFLASGDDNLLPDGFILAESLKFVRAELPAAQ